MKAIRYSIFIIALILVAALTWGSFYMLDYSLSAEHKGKDEKAAYNYLFEHPYMKQWVDSLNNISALKDTFIAAEDGTRLHAYYIAAAHPTEKTAVIVHGYTDNAIRIFMIGHLYNHEMNYNVLLPDLRTHGKSDGKSIQMGWKDRLDVIRWINVAEGIYGDSARIVIHGISMGAATTMMVSGEKLNKNVKCFVEDCGYTSVWDEFSQELKVRFNIPAFPLMYTTSWLCNLKYGWNFQEASALHQVEKCKLPMFFIHGDADTYVPTRMVFPLYEAKSGEKELWIVPGAKHAMSYWDKTNEYVKRVSRFVEKHI